MVYKNFSKYDIDIDKGTVFSFHKKDFLAQREVDGYIRCGVDDDNGNHYTSLHQIIYCVTHGVTLDDFPLNPNGRRWDVDHENGIRNDNRPENLVLKSHGDNIRNEITRKRFSEARKGKKNPNYGNKVTNENKRKIAIANAIPIDQIDKVTGEVLHTWESIAEASRNGYCYNSILCNIRGEYTHHKNCVWKQHEYKFPD